MFLKGAEEKKVNPPQQLQAGRKLGNSHASFLLRRKNCCLASLLLLSRFKSRPRRGAREMKTKYFSFSSSDLVGSGSVHLQVLAPFFTVKQEGRIAFSPTHYEKSLQLGKLLFRKRACSPYCT